MFKILFLFICINKSFIFMLNKMLNRNIMLIKIQDGFLLGE